MTEPLTGAKKLLMHCSYYFIIKYIFYFHFNVYLKNDNIGYNIIFYWVVIKRTTNHKLIIKLYFDDTYAIFLTTLGYYRITEDFNNTLIIFFFRISRISWRKRISKQYKRSLNTLKYNKYESSQNIQ